MVGQAVLISSIIVESDSAGAGGVPIGLIKNPWRHRMADVEPAAACWSLRRVTPHQGHGHAAERVVSLLGPQRPRKIFGAQGRDWAKARLRKSTSVTPLQHW